MGRCRYPQRSPHLSCTFVVIFILVLALVANLWFTLTGAEGAPLGNWGDNEKTRGNDKGLVIKGEDSASLDDAEVTTSDNWQIPFGPRQVKEIAATVKVQCEGTHRFNFFTVDVENEATFERILYQMVVDTTYENYTKQSDVWGKATIRMEMWLDPPLHRHKIATCVPFCNTSDSECGSLEEEEEDLVNNNNSPEELDRPFHLISRLMALTLDVPNRIVSCQGQEEIFGEENSFVQIVDEERRLVTLEKVAHKVINGSMVFTTVFPWKDNRLLKIKGIFCTLHLAQYYHFHTGWGFYVALLYMLIAIVITVWVYQCYHLRPPRLCQPVRRQESSEEIESEQEQGQETVIPPEERSPTWKYFGRASTTEEDPDMELETCSLSPEISSEADSGEDGELEQEMGKSLQNVRRKCVVNMETDVDQEKEDEDESGVILNTGRYVGAIWNKNTGQCKLYPPTRQEKQQRRQCSGSSSSSSGGSGKINAYRISGRVLSINK